MGPSCAVYPPSRSCPARNRRSAQRGPNAHPGHDDLNHHRIIPELAEPTVIARADHSVSRALIDSDALKVLYRLQKYNHDAYLVGGGVRDLLLGRVPKDFDIGTSARPSEVKRLFRNCWIIGRRFRLAHVKFGLKTIEVATFRRQLSVEEEEQASATDLKDAQEREAREKAGPTAEGSHPRRVRRPTRDNTFGTEEEDAFRRDFTINALFYDIKTFSVIDYVGGLEDLRTGLIRSIGDPHLRFVEDPVRMLRALAFATRLDFRLDLPVQRAIKRNRAEILKAAPARLIEELYKILRSGFSVATFRMLAETGLLKLIAPEIDTRKRSALWPSLDRLDTYRAEFKETPPTLSNAVLLGSLIQPGQPLDLTPRKRDDKRPIDVSLGGLPIARKDVERLRQALQLQTRLQDPRLGSGRVRSVLFRAAFETAVTWLTVHGDAPEAVERWTALAASDAPPSERKPRRRRRPRGRRRPQRATET